MQCNTITKLTPYVLLAFLIGCASTDRSLKKIPTDYGERAHVTVQPPGWVQGHVWELPKSGILSIDGIGVPGHGYYAVAPGAHTFVVAVDWSNRWLDQTELTFEAQAGKQYLLLTYELAPGEPEEKAEVRKYTTGEKAWGKAKEGTLATLVALLIIPLSVILVPVGVVQSVRALTGSEGGVRVAGAGRPFERCCFVWIQEEESGAVVAGERPGGGVHP